LFLPHQNVESPCIMKPAKKMKAVALIIFVAAQLFAQSDSAVELQGAIAKEQVDGDLKTAIAIYQKIAADKSAPRDVRAKALLHLARCDEKLGQQAQTVYRQIVRDFGDQPEAAQAKARLAVLKEADHPAVPAKMTQRRIELPSSGCDAIDGRRSVCEIRTASGIEETLMDGKSKRVIFKAGLSDALEVNLRGMAPKSS